MEYMELLTQLELLGRSTLIAVVMMGMKMVICKEQQLYGAYSF
jgi:hypothetical protein